MKYVVATVFGSFLSGIATVYLTYNLFRSPRNKRIDRFEFDTALDSMERDVRSFFKNTIYSLFKLFGRKQVIID